MTTWFTYTNPDWHEWEFRNMMRAGIDVFMPVYWWNGEGPQDHWSLAGVRTMNETWHALAGKLVAEGQAATLDAAKAMLPKMALFYDVTSMKQLWASNMSWTHNLTETNQTAPGSYEYWWFMNDGPDLDDSYWRHRFWTNIDDFLTLVDDEILFTWNNSHVVWLYGSGWFGNVGTGTFDYCREQALDKYNKSLYFVGDGGWQKAGLDAQCGWGASMSIRRPASWGIPAGGTGPGYYNLGAVYEQKPIYTPRDINVYKANWQELIDSNTAWIHVESWNELHEGTDIAWAQEHGWTWIDATREMVDIFHAKAGYDRFSLKNVPGIASGALALAAVAGIGAFLAISRRLD